MARTKSSNLSKGRMISMSNNLHADAVQFAEANGIGTLSRLISLSLIAYMKNNDKINLDNSSLEEKLAILKSLLKDN